MPTKDKAKQKTYQAAWFQRAHVPHGNPTADLDEYGYELKEDLN